MPGDMTITEYRRLLRKHGITVEIPPFGEPMDRLLERACDKTRSPAAKWALSHGRFRDNMLILPPDTDTILAVQKAVATAATEDTSLTVPAYEMVMAIDKAGSARVSDGAGDACGEGLEVSRAEIDAAKKHVGVPDKKRRPLPSDPLIVSYGLGVDSTALLVGLAALVREGRNEFRPDAILFADTGGEKDETYDYLTDRLAPWLKKVDFPSVQIVGWSTAHLAKGYGASRTLEQQALINQTMPSISASLFKSSKCSVLWKQGAMNRWAELQSGYFTRIPRTITVKRPDDAEGEKTGKRTIKSLALKPGITKIVKAIGYDASEEKRATKGTFRVDQELRDLKEKGRTPVYEYWYPLQSWSWDRARCIAEIEVAIGKAPPKSSCWFCGAMRKVEITALPKDKLMRALLIEAVANRGRHKDVQSFGLGGNFHWRDFALDMGLVTTADLSKINRQVETVLAAAPTGKGLEDEAGAQEGMRRLAAFSDVRGFRVGALPGHSVRGKRLPMWDRFDILADDEADEASAKRDRFE